MNAIAPIAELETRSADYQRIAAALDWLAARWRERPSLDEAAAAAGLSPHHFQRVFTRWAGVSPKTFVAALLAPFQQQADDLVQRAAAMRA